MSVLWLIAGMVLLILGAESLVRGAASLALRRGMSLLAVGLTIVAMGTSMPELTVSIFAGLKGHGAIAIGNIIGSNIINIGLVLGICALLRPVSVPRAGLLRDIPAVVVACLAFGALLYDGELSRTDGIILLALFIGYLIYLLRTAKSAEGEDPPPMMPVGWLDWMFIIAGVGLLALGGRIFANAAIDFAGSLGLSDFMIGVSVVAFATAAPELITSLVASLKKNSDFSVGNILSACVFNLLLILGVAAVIAPIALGAGGFSSIIVDLSVMTGLAALCWPLCMDKRIDRLEGALLLLVCGGYVAYLIMRG